MKKRAKLFTTIASLCMAVALMAFGVYAATHATFTITNTIQYTATPNINAVVSVASSATNVKDFLAVNDSNDLDRSEAEPEADTFALGDLTFVPENVNTKMTYQYAITIQNRSVSTDTANRIKVTFTKVPTAIEKTSSVYQQLTITHSGMVESAGNVTAESVLTVAAGATATITVAFEAEPTQSFDTIDLGINMGLEAIANA